MAAGSRHRVEISITDGPNLHGLTPTRIMTRRRHWRPLLGRLEEQRPGMRMSRGSERCWRTTVIEAMAWATVRASPGRGSGQGKKERGTRLGRSWSETWCGAALVEMEYRTTVALRWSEEQRHGRRLSDEHSCRRTIGVGITARATVRAGRESGQGRRERGTHLGWIGSETVATTVELAGIGAGVCRTAVASPTAATVVTMAPGEGRDRWQTAVANMIVTVTTEGG